MKPLSTSLGAIAGLAFGITFYPNNNWDHWLLILPIAGGLVGWSIG